MTVLVYFAFQFHTTFAEHCINNNCKDQFEHTIGKLLQTLVFRSGR